MKITHLHGPLPVQSEDSVIELCYDLIILIGATSSYANEEKDMFTARG